MAHTQPGLSSSDVGARVTVRMRLPGGEVSDVVGELESSDDETLAIRRRDGDLVTVAVSDVVVAKTVGPSLRAAIELEGVSARGWPAPDSAWLGNWWLRAADGFTARANSVRPLGNPGVPLDDALTTVHDWYAERGLPAQVQVVVGSSTDLQLRRRGWSPHPEVAVCTATVSEVIGQLGERGADPSGVLLSEVPSSGWLGLFRGGDPPPAALQILTGPPTTAFASVTGEPETLAIARGAVEPPWVGLSAIEVAPPARRQGHARAVIAAVLAWAREQGATRCYLEVSATNVPALALYESLGFSEHHRYACLEARRFPGHRLGDVLQLRDARTGDVKPVALARAGALRVHVCSADLRSLLVADLVRRVATLSHDLVVRVTATDPASGTATGTATGTAAGTAADAEALNIHPAQIVAVEPEADVRIGCPNGDRLLIEAGHANVDAGGRGRDPLVARLALLEVDYRKPVDLDDAALDAAAATLSRWRGLVAQWARSPGAPMAIDVARAISAAFDNDLDTSLALQELLALETADSVAPGAKFETFAYADRFFGLDLVRDIG